MDSFEKVIPVGRKFVSFGRTITEGDFSLLTNLTWTTDPIHTDRQYMKRTQFGDRILAGACILPCAIGLANRSGVAQVLDNDRVTRVAALGFDNVVLGAPVKPGDTISVHSEILEVRPSKKNPKRGIARVKETVVNETGQEVMTYIRSMILELIISEPKQARGKGKPGRAT